MKDPFTKEEYIQMRDNPKGGLEAWLPREWLDDKIAGRPHKYPQWYLDFGKRVRWLSDITLKMLEQVDLPEMSQEARKVLEELYPEKSNG